MNFKCEMVMPDWFMYIGLNTTQRSRNGMMEVWEEGVVGDVREFGGAVEVGDSGMIIMAIIIVIEMNIIIMMIIVMVVITIIIIGKIVCVANLTVGCSVHAIGLRL